MKIRTFGCRKFRLISSEQFDRDLNEQERHFLEAHRARCGGCSQSEHQGLAAMNMLRSASLEPELSPTFNERVLRRMKVSTTRESLRYWSPAFAGAVIAGMTVLAAMQLISRSVDRPGAGLPGGSAIHMRDADMPSLILRDSSFNRAFSPTSISSSKRSEKR